MIAPAAYSPSSTFNTRQGSKRYVRDKNFEIGFFCLFQYKIHKELIFFVCVIIIKEKENKKTGGGKRRRFPPPVSQKERMISMYADMLDTIGFVAKYDPELGSAMQEELARQRRNIELIASENLVSPAVMAAMGSVLTNKYAEGYPGKRYYGGCQCVDKVENLGH